MYKNFNNKDKQNKNYNFHVLKKLLKKIKNKELKEYLFWKLGINNLLKTITKDYWDKGKNYNWIYDILISEKENLKDKAFLEIGSRDSLDSINLLDNFAFSKAFIFEPSLPGIKECIENITNYKNRNKIIFFPFLIGEQTSLRKFYENNEKIDVPNIGASSIYSSGSKNEEIEYFVPQFSLSNLNLKNKFDFFLALIDVEGAELEVLSGGKDLFTDIKYICIEVQFTKNKTTSPADGIKVVNKLQSYGFELVMIKNFENKLLPKVEDITGSVDMLFKNSKYL